MPWMLRSRRLHCVLSAGTARLFLKPMWQAIPMHFATHLAPYHLRLAGLGLEAGPLSEWLVRGLEGHGFRAVLMETRQVCAALRPASPKQTARPLAAWPTFCAWVGSGLCTSKAWTRACYAGMPRIDQAYNVFRSFPQRQFILDGGSKVHFLALVRASGCVPRATRLEKSGGRMALAPDKSPS